MVLVKMLRNIPRNVISYTKAQSYHTSKLLAQIEHQTSSSSSDDSSSSSSDEEYEDNIKKNILKASLPFVLEHGWTKEAIGLGAESLGYSGASRGIFDNSGVALVHYFHEVCNQELNEHLALRKADGKVQSDNFLEVQSALETRLRMLVPVLPKWPQAMALSASPNNAPVSLKMLLHLADDICHHVGRNELDMSWYSRRMAVAGLYLAGELSLVQDKSVDFTQTWEFLGRRVEELRKVKSCTDQVQGSGAQISAISTAAFTTVKNILGFNSSR